MYKLSYKDFIFLSSCDCSFQRLIQLLCPRKHKPSVLDKHRLASVFMKDCDLSKLIIGNRNVRMTVKICFIGLCLS